MSTLERIAQTDVEMETLWQEIAVLNGKWRELRDLRSSLMTEWVTTKDLSLRELVQASWSRGVGNIAAEEKLLVFAKNLVPEVYGIGCEVNDNNEAVQPEPMLIVEKDTDIKKLAAGLKKLSKEFALEHEYVRYSFLEHTCGQYGFYNLTVSLDGTAMLIKTASGSWDEIANGGPWDEIASGSVLSVLQETVKRCWYNGDNGEYYDEYEDEDY
jgi:hypothetical protein